MHPVSTSNITRTRRGGLFDAANGASWRSIPGERLYWSAASLLRYRQLRFKPRFHHDILDYEAQAGSIRIQLVIGIHLVVETVLHEESRAHYSLYEHVMERSLV